MTTTKSIPVSQVREGMKVHNCSSRVREVRVIDGVAVVMFQHSWAAPLWLTAMDEVVIEISEV